MAVTLMFELKTDWKLLEKNVISWSFCYAKIDADEKEFQNNKSHIARQENDDRRSRQKINLGIEHEK